MSIRTAVIVIALTLMVATAAWLVPQDDARPPAVDPAPLTNNAAPAAAELPPVRVRAAATHTGQTDSHVAADVTDLPPAWPESAFEPHEFELDKVSIFRRFQAASEDWTVETFAAKVAQVDDLNGREAYEVYAYLRACHRQPRSVDQAAARAERVRNSDRARRRMSEEEINQYIASIEQNLVRCEALPADQELIPMMIGWLSLAAERGFPQAQLAYHKSIRWLLALEPWGVYRYPQQVHDYRRLAPLFLENALRSGHPDGFYEYAVALNEAVVFAEDAQAAYAYAYAATLAGGGSHAEAETVLQMLEPVLSPAQQREARASGRELCNTWCRGG